MSIGPELMLKLFSFGEYTKNKNRNVSINQKKYDSGNFMLFLE